MNFALPFTLILATAALGPNGCSGPSESASTSQCYAASYLSYEVGPDAHMLAKPIVQPSGKIGFQITATVGQTSFAKTRWDCQGNSLAKPGSTCRQMCSNTPVHVLDSKGDISPDRNTHHQLLFRAKELVFIIDPKKSGAALCAQSNVERIAAKSPQYQEFLMLQINSGSPMCPR